MEALDISIFRLSLLYLFLLLPMVILYRFKLRLTKDVMISVSRMTGQLILVGFYLKYLFLWNSLWLNIVWLVAMTLIANYNIIGKAGLAYRRFFWSSLLSVSAGTFTLVAIFLFVLIRPTPFYDTQYLIPLTGMLLGNCLSGNIIALERFYTSIKQNREEFIAYLMLGATLQEAIAPYLRQAISACVTPIIATMMTIGIVSLPGMMTGQILGGSFPLVAIKYQIMIVLGIFASLVLSATGNILLSLPSAFNSYNLLRDDVFCKNKR
ncbi:MAG: iron export ABC transporter permease subunit FetB [Desulfobulbaceae bacterium]|nr:iron export ABC transporter permease subunit FetB [Desulfobulbaceae bacterium]HIJ77979.1 iron export ABC transporter permease subunit FetB [Deltaproteobacteria bacterium]